MDKVQIRCEACRHRLFDMATLLGSLGRILIKCTKCKTINAIDLATALDLKASGLDCPESRLKYQSAKIAPSQELQIGLNN